MVKVNFSKMCLFAGIVLLISLFASPIQNNLQDVNAIAYFPPPLKQIKDGIEPSKVTCTEGFELVLKQNTGQPACLKPSSVAKLIDRGWAIHVLPDYTEENTNSEIFAL